MRALLLFTLLLANSFSFAASTVKQQTVKPDPALSAQQNLSSSKNSSSKKSSPKKHTSKFNVVWLDSITSSSKIDEDSDDYSQDLTITFDFDTSYQQIPVYIDMFLVDERDNQTKLTTSKDFVLTGESIADKQRFDIVVDEATATGYYHILINIYDAKTHQLIDIVDYHNNSSLADIRLEGHRFDHHDTFSLYNHNYSTSIDRDFDGYYQRIELTLDLDSIYSSQELQADILLDGKQLFASRPFTVYGSSTSDLQTFDLLVPSRFYSGTYELSARVTEVLSNHSEHSTTFDLGVVSVESEYNDQPVHTDVIVHESGSLHWFGLLGLGLLVVLRRLRR
ncbi:MAG: choice-of-anchor H family protein [Psychrobium sp.]